MALTTSETAAASTTPPESRGARRKRTVRAAHRKSTRRFPASYWKKGRPAQINRQSPFDIPRFAPGNILVTEWRKGEN
jgi:hypothetical protein